MYIDVTDASFETDVLNRSLEVPVVVDLWAEWCQPCKTLGPIIERVIDEMNGRVVLAKVDVDSNPRTSQAFQVQSIPAVFAIKDRKVIDQFVGALPEAKIRAWVSKFAPARSEADELADNEDEDSWRQALSLTPDHPVAIVKLAALLIERGTNHEAMQLLAKIPETTETRRLGSLARVGAETKQAEASGLIAELDTLLTQVRADEVAKQRYVDLLAVLGDDPRVPDLRRKLANQLF